MLKKKTVEMELACGMVVAVKKNGYRLEYVDHFNL